MKKKATLEDQINAFFEYWDCDKNMALLRDIEPLLRLYDVDEGDDWLKKEVGEEDERNVRLIKTAYLVSRLVDLHVSEFISIKYDFKDLWKRIEKEGGMDV